MRILDEIESRKIDMLQLLLTRSEAQELKDGLEDLLTRGHDHVHVSTPDFQKEVTVAIYDESDTRLEGFSERSKRLILKDE